MSKYQKQLFPINIFHNSVKDNEKIKSLLIPSIEKYKNQLSSPPKGWLTTKIITSFENEKVNSIFEKEELSAEIKSQYAKVLESFFDKQWQMIMGSIWFNYYENGEYQEPHTHLGSSMSPIHFSCVHFLSFDSSVHTNLCFIDPNRKLRSHYLEFDSNHYNEIYEMNVNEGDLIMFPSYLEHFVRPGISTPGNPRITISFNIRILKYGDDIFCNMSK
jgi:hypothetical protein